MTQGNTRPSADLGTLLATDALYPFRFRDPLSSKWVRARYVAERREIAALRRLRDIGPPEIRESAGALFSIGSAAL